MIWLQDWTIQEFIVFLGTTAIVVGLCNLSFGDKKDDAHLSRRVDEPADAD
jgi:hypothetical protein